MAWNIRGVGNSRGIQTLRDLVRKEEPNIVFLQETKLKVRVMEGKNLHLGFDYCLAMDTLGRSGGLAYL